MFYAKYTATALRGKINFTTQNIFKRCLDVETVLFFFFLLFFTTRGERRKKKSPIKMRRAKMITIIYSCSSIISRYYFTNTYFPLLFRARRSAADALRLFDSLAR